MLERRESVVLLAREEMQERALPEVLEERESLEVRVPTGAYNMLVDLQGQT